MNAMVDHLQQSGVDIGLGDTSANDDSLPSFMQSNMVSADAARTSVPPIITEQMADTDKTFLERVNWIHSDLNLSGKLFHEDVERHMQKRFGAHDMDILNAESTGPRHKRARARRIKISNHRDFQRLLEVRQQRYQLQKMGISNDVMRRHIDDLKSREFLLFAQIRVRYRSLNSDDGDRKRALAAVVTSADASFARAVFKITPAQAKSYLSALHKSTYKKKRPRAPAPSPSPRAPAPGIKVVRCCFHCGAFGPKYHNYTACPVWKAKKPPLPNTVHARMKKEGKKIPMPT